VQSLEEHRQVSGGARTYRVRWEGFTADEDTWEVRCVFAHMFTLVDGNRSHACSLEGNIMRVSNYMPLGLSLSDRLAPMDSVTPTEGGSQPYQLSRYPCCVQIATQFGCVC
jgi:hypothetical protein